VTLVDIENDRQKQFRNVQSRIEHVLASWRHVDTMRLVYDGRPEAWEPLRAHRVCTPSIRVRYLVVAPWLL